MQATLDQLAMGLESNSTDLKANTHIYEQLRKRAHLLQQVSQLPPREQLDDETAAQVPQIGEISFAIPPVPTHDNNDVRPLHVGLDLNTLARSEQAAILPFLNMLIEKYGMRIMQNWQALGNVTNQAHGILQQAVQPNGQHQQQPQPPQQPPQPPQQPHVMDQPQPTMPQQETMAPPPPVQENLAPQQPMAPTPLAPPPIPQYTPQPPQPGHMGTQMTPPGPQPGGEQFLPPGTQQFPTPGG